MPKVVIAHTVVHPSESVLTINDSASMDCRFRSPVAFGRLQEAFVAIESALLSFYSCKSNLYLPLLSPLPRSRCHES
jgi:hypothetical protein